MSGYKSVLITGGTGSFGRAFVRMALAQDPPWERVAVFSRDELKQFEMAQDPEFQDDRIRFFIGDVRDRQRLDRALQGIDVVIHAAALKQVPAAEYNPFEAIKTNVLGAQNVIDSCLDNGISRVVALSTDKAAAPINLYGATKLCSDKLFIAANNVRGWRDLRFCVVRYGNVMGSRGSVIPYFINAARRGVLPITHPDMTRFSITLTQAVDMVNRAIRDMWGGELYVLKAPSYRIMDLAKAIGPDCEHRVVGQRPGEKLHEEMITPSDALNCFEFDSHYEILPSGPRWNRQEVAEKKQARPVPVGFHYTSQTNSEFLSVDQLRGLIRAHVDPTFEPRGKS